MRKTSCMWKSRLLLVHCRVYYLCKRPHEVTYALSAIMTIHSRNKEEWHNIYMICRPHVMDQVTGEALALCACSRYNRLDGTIQRPLMNHAFIVGHTDSNSHNDTCFACKTSSFFIHVPIIRQP
jgi:hypothetical protein